MQDKEFICKTAYSIVTILVIGEALGGVISRPIRALRGGDINVKNLITLLDAQNQRICDLEEKLQTKEES